MSASNGVVRIGRKGLKKFAFGEDEPFCVDVVVAFQKWVLVDDGFREASGDRTILTADMAAYHQAAMVFVKELSGGVVITTAEALDFLARLREEYDALVDFFRPRSRDVPESQGTSEVETHFSAETP